MKLQKSTLGKLTAALAVGAIIFSTGMSRKEVPMDLQNADTMIVIQPETYLAQVTEICDHPECYVGQTITIQGVCATIAMEEMSFRAVYRIDPGCCGDDGAMHGFVFYWDGACPSGGSWITVSGTLVEDEMGYLGGLAITADNVGSAPRGDRVASDGF